jgi:hypothetical protein
MRFLLSAALTILSLSAAEVGPSENCRNRTKPVAPGTYTGVWELECHLQGGPQHMNMALVLRVKGDLKLEVGEQERLLSAESSITSSFGGVGDTVIGQAAATQEGSGRLRLKANEDGRPTTAQYFWMGGSGQAKGDLSLTTPLGTRSTDTSGSGELKGRFTLTRSECGVLNGDFKSEKLSQQMDAMAAVGYVVKWINVGSWQVTIQGEDTYAKRRQKLHEDLMKTQQTPQGIVYRRDGERQKLMTLLDAIDQEDEPLKGCLLDDWIEWARDRTRAWVTEDTANLQGTHTNASRYQECQQRLVSTLRQFAFLGLDRCSEALQRQAWKNLQDEGEARLKLLVDQGSTVEDVLQESRRAELRGEISPEASKEVEAYLKAASRRVYQEKHAVWKQLYEAAKNQAPGDLETLAFRRAVCALKTYVLMGGDDIQDGLASFQDRYR